MSDFKDQIDKGALCRECLDENEGGAQGHRWTCSSCVRNARWEAKRDEEWEARYGDQDSEYFTD